MVRFHLNFSMVALYETRLSLVTFEFCDGGVVQRNVFSFVLIVTFHLNFSMVALCETRLSLRHLTFAALYREMSCAWNKKSASQAPVEFRNSSLV